MRVELRDPAGRLRLRRDLPRSGETCVALAQAVALVLEAFFRRPTEPPDDSATTAPPGIVAPAAAAPARPAVLGWGPGLDLLGGWADGPSGPALAVDVWYGPGSASPWAFGVEGVWMATEQRLTIDLRALPDRQPPPRAARCFVAGWRVACASRRRSSSCSGRRSCWGSIAWTRPLCPTGCPTSGPRRGQGAGPSCVCGWRRGSRCRWSPRSMSRHRPWPGGSRSTAYPASCSRSRQSGCLSASGLGLALFP